MVPPKSGGLSSTKGSYDAAAAKNVTTILDFNYAVESARSAGATQGYALSAFYFWLSKTCASGRYASTYFHLLPWLTVISRLSDI